MTEELMNRLSLASDEELVEIIVTEFDPHEIVTVLKFLRKAGFDDVHLITLMDRIGVHESDINRLMIELDNQKEATKNNPNCDTGEGFE